jgi:hypothetical protein
MAAYDVFLEIGGDENCLAHVPGIPGCMVRGKDEAELARHVPAPWNPKDTNYRWIALWIHHEREHAADLRKVLNLPDFPERLTYV